MFYLIRRDGFVGTDTLWSLNLSRTAAFRACNVRLLEVFDPLCYVSCKAVGDALPFWYKYDALRAEHSVENLQPTLWISSASSYNNVCSSLPPLLDRHSFGVVSLYELYCRNRPG